MEPRLPSNDSATGRGLKTAFQAMVGFVIGLATVIWAVPGVPEAVMSYMQDNLSSVLLMVGASSGVVSFIWNLFRKDVPNY